MSKLGKFAAACAAVVFGLGAEAATWYVGPDGSDDNAGTSNRPFKTVERAVAACAGAGEIVIFPSAASYVVNAEIALSSAITMRSSTGNPADVVLERLSTAKDKYRLVRLDCAEASVSGLTLSGGYSDTLKYGGGVRITAKGGTLENCIVTNCVASGTACGGGIYIEANSPGLVDRCRIDGCSLTAAGVNYTGAGVGMEGGTVRNSIVVRNKSTASAANRGSAVWVNGGTFEYCTVVNNESDYCAGVIANNKGRVANCLIGACRSKSAMTPEDALWYGTASCFTNCVVSGYINDCCPIEIDPFEAVADDKWMPKVGSAALDAGAPADWLQGATDFTGAARVSGAAADIGAVERNASAFAASFLASAEEGTAPLAVTLTAHVANAPDSVTYGWDWNGDGTIDKTTNDAEITHSFDEGDYRIRLTVTAGGQSYTVPGFTPIRVAAKTIAVPLGGSISAAIAAASVGTEIVLAKGQHNVTDAIIVDKAVVIRGETGNPEDVILHSDGRNHRAFIVCNKDAVVHSLVVENAVSDVHSSSDPYGGVGAGICLRGAGGTVSNCVVRGCTIKNWNQGGGGIGIANGASAALVTHCVISNCLENGAGNSAFLCGGGAVAMLAGTVRNCLIVKNVRDTSPGDNACLYGTVRIANGTLESCTIADNTAGRCAGVWASGGSVVNCLIAGNRTVVDLDAKLPVWTGKAEAFSNCVADVEINDTCKPISVAPYVDLAKGDYRPAAGTVSVNGAVESSWMAGATDLAGNDRIRGAKPDVGCYEVDPNAFAATFAMSAQQGFAPATVSCTVTPVNGGGESYTCEWDWNGDGLYEETKTTLTASKTFEEFGEYPVAVRVTDEKSGVAYTTPAQVFTVYPKTLYVKKGNSGAVAPYGSEETAAPDIQTALAAAADGCEIVLLPDTYTITAAILVDKGVHIRGQTGNPEDVILHSDRKNHRVFDLNNKDATVSSLVVENAKEETQTDSFGGMGAGIRIRTNGGTVSNCVVRGCEKTNWTPGGGIGIVTGADDALVTHCVVSNCLASGAFNSAWLGGGGALVMFAGNVRNCLFTKNVRTDSTRGNYAGCHYGTVRVAGGTLANCTIADNSAGTCAGVWSSGGEIVNCLIAGNKTLVDKDANLPVWAGDETKFTACVSDIEINGNCPVVTAPFTDAATGDYRPAPGTASVNGGVLLGWMTGATDLEGNDRVRGAKPDVGCYEVDPDAFSATFAMSSAEGFKPATVTFTVTPVNDGGQGVICEWDWNGDGRYEAPVESTETTHEFTDFGKYNVSVRLTDKASGKSFTTPSQRFTVFPKTLYVSATGSATPPYADAGSAAPDVASALAEAADGCEIVLQPDTYTITAAIYVDKGVVIRGATGNPEDVILHSDGKSHRVFDLNHAQAVVCSLVVENAKEDTHAVNDSAGGLGAGIRIRKAGGTVSNCVIRACKKTNWNHGGGGIGIASGADTALVTHCVVSNCSEAGSCNSGYLAGGGALSMYAGNVRNCLFTKNVRETAAGDVSCFYGTVRIEGGTLENCTVAGNSAGSCAGVWATKNAVVRNCLIAGNVTTKDVAANLPVWAGDASKFSSCVSDVTIGSGNDVALSPFIDAASGNYRLAVGTAAVDGADWQEWMDDSTDLDGTSRVKGEGPDVGCYELAPVFAVGCEADTTKGQGPLTVKVTATVSNAGGEGYEIFVDWGEGAGEERQQGTVFEHTYETPGVYAVNVRAYSIELAESTSIAPIAVTVVPSVVWVRPDGDGAVFPYLTRETAATNIAEAIELAVDGCEVRLVAGTYLLAEQFEVGKAIRVNGETGRPADVVLRHDRGSGSKVVAGRVAYLKNSAATLAAVTVENGYLEGNGAGVYISPDGGIVSNCIVRACDVRSWSKFGGGVYVAAPGSAAVVSLVTHCCITGCTVEASVNVARSVDAGAGTALAAFGGIVRNTLMTRNAMHVTTAASTLGGTVYLRGGALVENCTVVSNEAAFLSGIQIHKPTDSETDKTLPVIRNTIVSANVSTSPDAQERDRVCYGYDSCFDHCVSDVAIGGVVRVEDPALTFRNTARGDWRLRDGSAAIDYGTYAAWMTGATDLRGHARVSGRRPDAGCYESAGGGFSLIVR